jgi:3-oxoacyl-[acyl-carrier protein] reductase
MINFQGKIAIVTGSTRGIGRAIAETLAKNDCSVVISSRNNEAVQSTVNELKSLGYQVSGYAADISNIDEAKALVNFAVEKYGKVDILINNAGITKDGLLMRMKVEDWDEVLHVNLTGIFNMCQAILRPMMKNRYGRIINISSIVGQMGNAGQINYSAAKAGILGFTKSLAREISSRGITVNAIAPGYIETDMTQAMSETAKETLTLQIPLGRIGSGEDVAHLSAFLASDLASYITGQVVNVDGGLVMQG